MKIILIVLAVIVLGVAIALLFVHFKKDPRNSISFGEGNVYEINAQSTDQKTFEDFLNSLEGKEDWSCDETTYGGVTSYYSKGRDGATYYVSLQTGGQNLQSITKQ